MRWGERVCSPGCLAFKLRPKALCDMRCLGFSVAPWWQKVETLPTLIKPFTQPCHGHSGAETCAINVAPCGMR
ncbi:hypothetical protein HaLaN_25394 [Haematococcus lacustris]|uniref:Uncharacterized protein n=1 Tax=Haematococcus lacustris TaxID=44745 RepID=A0A6A0A3H9_HAELA|nr:hypothetical protein HaLaN_25394 [Haematococcus lacustris]